MVGLKKLQLRRDVGLSGVFEVPQAIGKRISVSGLSHKEVIIATIASLPNISCIVSNSLANIRPLCISL